MTRAFHPLQTHPLQLQLLARPRRLPLRLPLRRQAAQLPSTDNAMDRHTLDARAARRDLAASILILITRNACSLCAIRTVSIKLVSNGSISIPLVRFDAI